MLSYVLQPGARALILTMSLITPLWAVESIPDTTKTASVSLGAEYSTGNYGTGSTIRSVYTPLIATWLPTDRIDIGVEIPLIYQSSSQVTTDLYRTRQGTATAKTLLRGGPGGNGGAGSQQQAGGGSSAMASGASDAAVSGLGDIILRLGAIALFESGNVPQLRPSLFIKCPTASTSEGLGTGEFDLGIGIEASKWLGDMHLTGEGFYTYQGRADGFALKNYLSYTGGLGYQLTKSFEPMLVIKGASAPSAYSGNLLEARARVIWALTGTTVLDLYASRGIADSSPDYGGGVAVIYSF